MRFGETVYAVTALGVVKARVVGHTTNIRSILKEYKLMMHINDNVMQGSLERWKKEEVFATRREADKLYFKHNLANTTDTLFKTEGQKQAERKAREVEMQLILEAQNPSQYTWSKK
jgi:hypothetical protein